MDKIDRYNYPDPNDQITQRMISQFGEDYQRYWAYSEDSLLKEIISSTWFPPQNYKLLDIGCGEGRLFHYFVDSASRITGIEPDVERYQSATQMAEHLNSKNPECHIKCVNESFDNASDLGTYDIVLSSHVLQHISTDDVDLHLKKMINHTAANGVIIIHTTYTSHTEDLYKKSIIDTSSQQWQETDIDQETFNGLVNAKEILPVHMFSLQTLKKKMASLGYELVAQHLFHADRDMVDHYGIEKTDELLNAPDRKFISRGRDISMVFKKGTIIKKGSITGCYPFAIKVEENKLLEQFHGKYTSDIPCHNHIEECTGRCLEKANNFHKRTDNNTKETILLDTINLTIDLHEIGSVPIFFWFDLFKNDNVGILCCSLSLQDISIKEAIALKNFFKIEKKIPTEEKKNAKSPKDRTNGSNCISKILEELAKVTTKRKIKNAQSLIDDCSFLKTIQLQYCLLEINEVCGEQLADSKEFVLRHNLEMYGLMTGDEGYSYVPEYIAEKRLTDYFWQTRGFLYFTCFGKNALIINGKNQMDNYVKDQVEYVTKYEIDNDISKNRKSYFQLNSCLAGVDHGVLDAVENVLITLLELQFLRSSYFLDEDHDVIKIRQKLKKFLHSKQFIIEEINSLQSTISTATGLPRLMDETKDLLESITDDINIQDQVGLNILMSGLTLCTVLIGFFTIMTEKTNMDIKNHLIFCSIVLVVLFIPFVDIFFDINIIQGIKRLLKRLLKRIIDKLSNRKRNKQKNS